MSAPCLPGHCLSGYRMSFSTHRAVLPQDLVKFEAARFGFRLFQSLWGLTCTSTEVPRCLSICKEMRSLYHQISRLPDFARFGVMTSYRLVNKRHGLFCQGINYTIITKQTAFQLQLEKQICGIDVVLIKQGENYGLWYCWIISMPSSSIIWEAKLRSSSKVVSKLKAERTFHT